MVPILPEGSIAGWRQASACRYPLLLIGLPALPVAAAGPITLRAAERERLRLMTYGRKTEYRLRMRAQVVLHAARGKARVNAHRKPRNIATMTGLTRSLCCPTALSIPRRGRARLASCRTRRPASRSRAVSVSGPCRAWRS
jgi:hypothetical protein